MDSQMQYKLWTKDEESELINNFYEGFGCVPVDGRTLNACKIRLGRLLTREKKNEKKWTREMRILADECEEKYNNTLKPKQESNNLQDFIKAENLLLRSEIALLNSKITHLIESLP